MILAYLLVYYEYDDILLCLVILVPDHYNHYKTCIIFKINILYL